MKEIEEHVAERLHIEETQIGSVTVDVEATSLTSDRDEEFLLVARRLERAAKAEIQAMQDELDEDGEVREA